MNEDELEERELVEEELDEMRTLDDEEAVIDDDLDKLELVVEILALVLVDVDDVLDEELVLLLEDDLIVGTLLEVALVRERLDDVIRVLKLVIVVMMANACS